jgi:hypothetical protein
VWEAREPLAPYLTTATIGEFDLRSYRVDGIRYWDAIDPDLARPAEPRTGQRFAISQAAQPSYKRLARTVPGGGRLSFWVLRDTEPGWDFVFVEAHRPGSDEWTTLPDRNGHTSADTGFACPLWHELHPFLAHYQTATGDETCSPSGTTGTWAAAYGRYPFSAAGGIVDDTEEFATALEIQTRPVYGMGLFADPTEPPAEADSALVHELAHQWVGDSVSLSAWRHVWLNEGFASYAQWLWSEHEGLDSAQQQFDYWAALPADDPFWAVKVGDPGPDRLFDIAVYMRGAMTLHALRQAVGDRDFFRVLRAWAHEHAGGNAGTEDFVALAERISGRRLDAFFTTWLFTPAKPPGI